MPKSRSRIAGGVLVIATAGSAAAQISTLNELEAALLDCCEPPPIEQSRPDTQITVLMSFKRNGESGHRQVRALLHRVCTISSTARASRSSGSLPGARWSRGSRGGSLTWPVVTVFGFIAEPTAHVFLKPTVTKRSKETTGEPNP